MSTTIFNLFGGLGLLLIGMSMMTDGLKLASGNSLRDLLALWTNSRRRGLLSGFLITGVVQSSSAVTVATIGFANAGMLTLERAIWVIYGSNVGTTMTAWIVALLGFKINIEALALPLIGLGAVLKLTGANSKRASVGLALIGFGLLFLGISFMKTAFDTLGTSFTLPAMSEISLLTICLYVLIGFMLTSVMQSSSATMVIALSAAESGLLPLNAAAAVIIGANLGTTTTAALSVIGATSIAKRVAISHIIFNLVTAVVAIAILPFMLWLIAFIESVLNLNSSSSVSLAIFHSVFNILGVLLMWPISDLMVKTLKNRFTTRDEVESHPRYLDKNVLALPYIAADAMALEVSRINQYTIEAYKSILQLDQAPHAVTNTSVHTTFVLIRKLANEIGKYSTELNRDQLTPFLAEVLNNLIESTQQFLLAIDIAEDITTLPRVNKLDYPENFRLSFQAYMDSVAHHLEVQDLNHPGLDSTGPQSYEEVEIHYRVLKNLILSNGAAGNLDMYKLDQLLQFINQTKRGCRQIMKATQRLVTIRFSLQRNQQGEVMPSDKSDRQNIDLLNANSEAEAEADSVIPDSSAKP